MMRAWLGRSLVVLALLCMVLPIVSAHSPQFPGDNESLDGAMPINEPTKSWVIYNTLHEGGEAQYYKMEFGQGDEINIMLTVPPYYTEKGFLPGLVLMGPGLVDDGTPPAYITTVPGAGVQVFPGDLPLNAEYEPFSPSAIATVAETVMTAPQNGTYYVVVYSDTVGGNYGLAVGARESFTAEEWLLIPFNAYRIYIWEGQPVWAVVAPPLLTFVLVVAVMMILSRRRGVDAMWVVLTISGALMMASAAMLLSQMVYSIYHSELGGLAAVTVLIAGIGILLGSAALRIAHRDRSLTSVSWGTRAWLMVIFIVGLLVWAGWLVGPVLAAVAAVLPGKVLRGRW